MTPAQIDALITTAFATVNTNGAKAVLVTADPVFNDHRGTVLSLAASYSLPAIYQWREFVDAGGLISFGTNITLAYQLAGIYVGRIVAGIPLSDARLKPITLNSTELIINLSTANTLGINIPDAVLAQANEVIV
jgi:putative tryptophan/tyrosine transport system substrate-binding protein